MRCLLAVVVLAACAHAPASGPAWPKPATSSSDGGESLAPHESRQVVTAVEKSEPEPKPTAPATPAAPVAPAPTVGAAAVPAMTTQPVEEPMTVEDIIIEIDE